MDELEKTRLEKMKEWMEKREKKELIIKVDDNNFNEMVIEQSKKVPVVVDFWATWCMPCLALSPALEKLVKEYNGKFILTKLNVDEGRLISQEYGIQSIPTVKIFKDGKTVDGFIGALPEQFVREWLNKNLGS